MSTDNFGCSLILNNYESFLNQNNSDFFNLYNRLKEYL